MPTTRPRYQITETDEVSRALDAAEVRWPGEPRSRLLVRLIVESGESVREAAIDEATRRRAAIAALGGSFEGLYPEGYREALRSEWPA